MSISELANQRVRQRIKDWVAQHGYGSQRQLARAVPAKFGEPRGDQWISDILKGRSDVRLKDLDYIAEAMGVPPGWLVRLPDRNYEELTMQESKMLTYFRALPDTVRHACLICMDYCSYIEGRARGAIAEERDRRTTKARKLESPHARRKQR
jgi:transcriptional regulator with XRE-family HTH domain